MLSYVHERSLFESKKASPPPERISSITATINRMEDVTGLVYFGCEVAPETLVAHLAELERQLGNDLYTQVTAAKATRDGAGVYHVTVIKPPEMRKFGLTPGTDEERFWDWRSKTIQAFMSDARFNKDVQIDLYGLGHIVGKDAEEGKEAYYAIAQSTDVVNLRAELDEYLRMATLAYNKDQGTHFTHEPLGPIHLHVTLGFEGGDVHRSGDKDLTTLWV